MAVLTAKQLASQKQAQQASPPRGIQSEVVRTVSSSKTPRNRIREVENPKEKPVWVFLHPDNTDQEFIMAGFIVEIPGRGRVTIFPEFGRYETTDEEVAKAMKAKGMRHVNDSPVQDIDTEWDKALRKHKEQRR